MSPSLPANHMLSHTVTQHHLTITQLTLPGVYYHCSLHDYLNRWFIKCNNDHFITDGITTLNSSLLSSLDRAAHTGLWTQCSCLSLALTDNKTEFWLSSALAGAGVTQSAPSRAVPCGGWRVRGGGRGLYCGAASAPSRILMRQNMREGVECCEREREREREREEMLKAHEKSTILHISRV